MKGRGKGKEKGKGKGRGRRRREKKREGNLKWRRKMNREKGGREWEEVRE